MGFAFICLSCYHFSIFVICSCGNVTAVSGLVCLTSTAVSSANVSILLLVVVSMSAVYSVYNIGPTLPCGTLALTYLYNYENWPVYTPLHRLCKACS